MKLRLRRSDVMRHKNNDVLLRNVMFELYVQMMYSTSLKMMRCLPQLLGEADIVRGMGFDSRAAALGRSGL